MTRSIRRPLCRRRSLGRRASHALAAPVPLEHGDVVVRGGPARLHFHGTDTLHNGRIAMRAPFMPAASSRQ